MKSEKYKSRGFNYSIEGGLDYEIGKNVQKNRNYYIQPKAQIIYMGVKTKDHREHNGTLVEVNGNGNIQSRIGVKTYFKQKQNTQKGVIKYQPFVEFNWIHNTKEHNVLLDGTKTKQAGTKDIVEAKIGLDINIRDDINIYGNVAQQWGKNDYKNTKVTVGIKYRF